MSSYSFVDLFAGCGGLSLGLRLAGLRGRFAVERDPMAFATFSQNFLGQSGPDVAFDWPSWLAPKPWPIEDLLAGHRDDLRRMQGAVEILAGGPPCQGFSMAGRRNEADPRNLMFHKYVEFVDLIRPKALILENVPGMKIAYRGPNVVPIRTRRKSTPGRQSFYDRLEESLRGIGYVALPLLVDASRYGVPQRRSRLIVFGLRRELLQHADGGIGRFAQLLEAVRIEQLATLGLPEAVSASDALSDLEVQGRARVECRDPDSPRGFEEVEYGGPRTAYQRLMHKEAAGRMNSLRLARHGAKVEDRFERILADVRKGVRMDERDRAAYGLKKHRIFPLHPDEPAATVTTLPEDILHYSEPRILSVRECARLQSFPDWFEFRGKYTTGGDRRTKECPRYTQVGNAVPPLLARALGKATVELLEEIRVTRSVFGDDPDFVPSAARA